MTDMLVQLDDRIADEIRRLAAAQDRSETDIVREALSVYVQSARPLPKGMGKYHSGDGKVSEQARALLREAVKDKQWP